MRTALLSALVVLLLALTLQIQLASIGIHFNVSLATLIAFALIFEFFELLFFVLLSVFLLNAQPAPSITMIVFAGIPFAAYFSKKLSAWQPPVHVIIAIFFGFLIFYLVSAPPLFIPNFSQFANDVILGSLVGESVLFALGQ